MITPASPLLSIPAYRLAGTAFASSCFKVFPTPLLFVVLVMLARLLLSIVAVLPTFFLPVRVFTAVQAMKAAHITRPNCRFCMGIPVSATQQWSRSSRVRCQVNNRTRLCVGKNKHTRHAPIHALSVIIADTCLHGTDYFSRLCPRHMLFTYIPCSPSHILQLCDHPFVPSPAVSCPRGPSPVATSPSSAATKPSCASRPANSSFCAVKPQSVTPKNFLTWNRVTLGLPRGPSAASAWFAATCSGLKVADLGSRPATRLKPTRPARNRPTCASGRSYR
eukprot:GHRQ01005968.1.p1 GENE.GHRQ01005968.1~~GHRQ01005968.1.p1  ORF type:complete len:278 (-),score=13.40 GHRQ01005968.1:463-1296(-)